MKPLILYDVLLKRGTDYAVKPIYGTSKMDVWDRVEDNIPDVKVCGINICTRLDRYIKKNK